MKTLQITLFIIANVIFISQAARHVHQLVFGSEGSVLDQFNPDRQQAKAEGSMDVLLADYKAVMAQIDTLEKGRNYEEARDLRQQNQELYEKQSALHAELAERERKSREMRDTWLFAGFGLLLIVAGSFLYCRTVWPGFALVVTGFCILEYWASPSFFSGGAVSEFHQLLISKTVLTAVALAALHVLWKFRTLPDKRTQTSSV
jgi:hypothetical protein